MESAFPVLAGILGLVLGRFYAACAYGYIHGLPFFRPRSVCPRCGVTLRARDLVPVASWLALRGRCAACGGCISLFYPLVESVSCLCAVLLAVRFGVSPAFWVQLALCGVLITASAIDARIAVLPDALTLGGALVLCPLMVWSTALTWRDSCAGALLGFALAGGLHLFFRYVRKKTALGLGDVKLFLLLGGVCGWQGLPGICLISSVTAASALILLHLRAAGNDGNGSGPSIFARPIPFGPFLSLGAFTYLLWSGSGQFRLILHF